MKIILTMIVSIFLAAATNAQTVKSNFAGDWELDAVKSTLPAAMQVDSMKLRVSQTDKELSVESVSKLPKSAARGVMKNVGAGGGTQTLTYNLEGKDTTVDIGSGIMAGKEIRKAVATADGKLNLTVTKSFSNEMGGVPTKTNEIWELLDEGKTLKVTRYMETPSGATNAEMFFTRKTPVPAASSDRVYRGEVIRGDMDIPANEIPKKISGGVLNGKAVSMPLPAYPAAAKAVQASGAVNVQVTINEQGEVVSASAVSGHPLLRQAAEKAAREAKFSPTLLQGVPVSVTGIIIYNFTP